MTTQSPSAVTVSGYPLWRKREAGRFGGTSFRYCTRTSGQYEAPEWAVWHKKASDAIADETIDGSHFGPLR